jgi:hypothetical protein
MIGAEIKTGGLLVTAGGYNNDTGLVVLLGRYVV